MAEINLGKVKMTEAEMQDFVRKCNGGFQFGTDENGNDGYFKYDEEAGADTFVPFKKGGSAGTGAIASPYTHVVKFEGSHCSIIKTDLYTYFPVKNVTKLLLKTLSLRAKKMTSTASSTTFTFEICGKKKDGSASVIKSYSVYTTSNTSYTSTTVEEVELDLDEYESIEYVHLIKYSVSGTSYIYYCDVYAEFELYF